MQARSLFQKGLNILRFKPRIFKFALDPFNISLCLHTRCYFSGSLSHRKLSTGRISSLIPNHASTTGGLHLFASRRSASIFSSSTSAAATKPTLEGCERELHTHQHYNPAYLDTELTPQEVNSMAGSKNKDKKGRKKETRDSKEVNTTAEADIVGASNNNPVTPNVTPSKHRKKRQHDDNTTLAATTGTGIAERPEEEEKANLPFEAETNEDKVVTTKSKKRRNSRVRCTSTTTAAVVNEIEGTNGATAPRGSAQKEKEEEQVLEESIEEIQEEEVITTTVVKKQRKKREPDPLPCIDPTPELLLSLEEESFTPAPLPVPNLGYACLCMELRELNPPVFTSRDCIKRTLDSKGVSHLGELTLANCKDLARVIQYNQEKNIRFFRMSSVLQPWMGVHDIRTFPQFEEIRTALEFAGNLARKYGQRLSFHPSHFVKLAAETDSLVEKSIAELEGHSYLLDLMGFIPATPENKINIHVGGVYGDKPSTLQRWAKNYKRLSPNCRARVTVENDDVASAYSVDDLLELHRLCDGTLPIVFDFHHYKFCPGALTQEQALRAAIATWPKNVRPVVHWSESQPGRKPHAHSDYVRGPIFLHGLENDIDVMIESKCKERALLAYRDGLPIPEVGCDSGVEEGEGILDADAETALKLL